MQGFKLVVLHRGRATSQTFGLYPHYPTHHVLRQYQYHEASAVLSTTPWEVLTTHTAITCGAHQSMHDHQQFLHGKMAAMVRVGQWPVLFSMMHSNGAAISSAPFVSSHCATEHCTPLLITLVLALTLICNQSEPLISPVWPGPRAHPALNCQGRLLKWPNLPVQD